MTRHLIAALSAVAVMATFAASPAPGDGRRSNRPPAEILRPPVEVATLDAKSGWALKEATEDERGREFWIGYSIERLMGQRSHIGSFTDGGRGRDLTIAEILSGAKAAAAPSAAGEDLRGAARAALDGIEAREGAVFSISKVALPGAIDEIIALARGAEARDVRKKAVFWLGECDDPRALETLIAIIKGK